MGKPGAPSPLQAAATNLSFYEGLWSGARLLMPERQNTWPLISALSRDAPSRLELGPGLRPRLPIPGTHFVDISRTVVAQLDRLGGLALPGRITHLPFRDRRFDLLGAFDVFEHEPDDAAAFREAARVLKPGRLLVFTVPLHPSRWTEFDAAVGHCRRYRPEELLSRLAREGFEVEQSGAFGPRPRSRLVLRLGLWFLEHRRRTALFWYNLLSGPAARWLGRPLALEPGLIDTARADEILLVCRRR